MFRFSIRDVLWLTVVAGLVCAWWIDHSHLKAAIDPFGQQRTLSQFILGTRPPPQPSPQTGGDPFAPP
jgi:hypothetical protein